MLYLSSLNKRFPAEYRAFLLEVGNGIMMGDGPCREGILRLGKTPVDYLLEFPEILSNLTKQFPYEYSKYEEYEGIDIHDPHHPHKGIGGYIILGTALNSYKHYWILICNGICRGEVWIVTCEGGFFPCTPRLSFKDWLQDWAENEGLNMEESLLNTKNYPPTSNALRIEPARLFSERYTIADLLVNFRNYQSP